MSKTTWIATTALVTALLALAISIWAVLTATRTGDEIRTLGEILSPGRSPHQMSVDRPPPPRFDPDDL